MISFSWSDFSEKYDNPDILKQCSFDSDIPAASDLCSHILIEGDNYPALQLLKDKYNSAVDLIYIDPPYNTGNTFTYDDNFSVPTDDSHSKWLSFMNRRLKLAKSILSDSGCIFIAIGQEELFHLKLLCDLIFGEENYINDFMWLHGKGKKDSWSRTLEQHTLCYAKNKKALKSFRDVETTTWAKTNADNDPRGNWFSGSISFTENRSNPNHQNYFSITSPSGKIWTRQWLVSKNEMNKLLKEDKIYFGNAPDFDHVPRVKVFDGEKNDIIPQNIISQVETTREAQKHLDELIGVEKIFDNPKPVDLISHFIFITQMKPDAIIMDFFAGSGTTFEAVLNQNKKDNGNRKCILIQKPENTFIIKNGKKIPRKGSEIAYNAGFETISEICYERMKKTLKLYASELNSQQNSIKFIKLKEKTSTQ